MAGCPFVLLGQPLSRLELCGCGGTGTAVASLPAPAVLCPSMATAHRPMRHTLECGCRSRFPRGVDLRNPPPALARLPDIKPPLTPSKSRMRWVDPPTWFRGQVRESNPLRSRGCPLSQSNRCRPCAPLRGPGGACLAVSFTIRCRDRAVWRDRDVLSTRLPRPYRPGHVLLSPCRWLPRRRVAGPVGAATRPCAADLPTSVSPDCHRIYGLRSSADPQCQALSSRLPRRAGTSDFHPGQCRDRPCRRIRTCICPPGTLGCSAVELRGGVAHVGYRLRTWQPVMP